MDHGILKNQITSIHGLKGETPATREGASTNSQLHAQGSAPTTLQAGASIYDLDGQTPSKYLDNPPE